MTKERTGATSSTTTLVPTAGPGACPDAETLAGFLDGKLSAKEPQEIADHVSRCENCYWIVRETTAAPVGSRIVPIDSAGRMFRLAPQRYLWAAAAASLLLALGAAVVARERGLFLSARDRARLDLVRAVGKRRFLEARLTGGFQYGPQVSVKRGLASAGSAGGGAGAEDWEVLAASARIKKDTVKRSDTTSRAALASAHLVLGECDAAVTLLEGAVQDDEKNAWLLSDLAAGYLARAASEGRGDDLPRALENAARAVEIDPTLREALYNRAIALEAMALPEEAITAWGAFLAVERDAEWRKEAERRQEALRNRPRSDFENAERRIREALAKTADDELDTAVQGSIGIARDIFELELLPNVERRTTEARRLAHSFARVTGDSYQEAILRLAPPARLQSRGQLFARARREYDSNRRSHAAAFLKDVLRLGHPEDVLGLWSRAYLAGVTQNTDLARASNEIEQVILGARSGSYRVLLGRALWLAGIIEVSLGRQDKALLSLREARDVLNSVGHTEYVAYMELMEAEAYTELGNDAKATESLLNALRRRDLLREPARRVGVLISAEQESVKRGLPLVALSILREAKSSVSAAGAESLPMQWTIDFARAAEAARPGSGLAELAGADMLLAGIRDPSTHARMAFEVSVARGELSTPGSRDATLSAVDHAIRAVQDRHAFFRLPTLQLNRGRLASDLGMFREAEASYREGLAQFEKPQSLQDDLVYSAAYRALDLYGGLIDALVERGAPPEESLSVAERAYGLSYGGASWSPRSIPPLNLAERQAVVAYFRTGTSVVAWVVRRDGVTLHALERRLLGGRLASPKAWFDTLLQPLLPRLAGAERVVIVPHEGLHDIPFASLPVATGQPFGAVFAVSFAPSLAFAVSQRSFQPPHKLLVVGDPDTLGRYPRLSGANQEARRISARHGGATLLTGTGATAAAVVAALSQADGVHLATHGFLNRRLPSRSGLALGGGADADLLARDIARLRLDNLVVVTLAACESAATSGGSVGTFSLARPFLRAGAGSVLGALQEIRDDELSGIYEEFLSLVAGGVAPSRALQRLHVSHSSPSHVALLKLYAPMGF